MTVPVMAAGQALAAAEKPNIVFVLIDDMGWTDAKCFGSDFYETPNIDRLYSQSMYFPNAYMASSICSPSRAALNYGQYPGRYDFNEVADAQRFRSQRGTKLIAPDICELPPGDGMTLPRVLQTAGYHTALIGKWHVGGSEETRPLDFGYQERLHRPRDTDPADMKNIDWITDQAIDFMARQKDSGKPFFLFVSHEAIHHDYYCSDELLKKYEEKLSPGLRHSYPVYAGNLEHLDRGIGRMMDGMEKLGLSENTIVVFSSDNGGRTANIEYQRSTSNHPLKHGKHTFFEGGVRVPLMVRWPGRVTAGAICETPVHGVDFLPTFADIAQVDTAVYSETDGVSFFPLCLNRNVELTRRHDGLYWYYPHYILELSPGPKTYCAPIRPMAAIRKGDWKLLWYFEDAGLAELFNLREDAGEETNMAKKYPQLVDEMKSLLFDWLKDTGTALPKSNPLYNPELPDVLLKKSADTFYPPVTGLP